MGVWNSTIATLDCSTMKVVNFVNASVVGPEIIAMGSFGYDPSTKLLYSAAYNLNDLDAAYATVTIDPTTGDLPNVYLNRQSVGWDMASWSVTMPDKLLALDSVYLNLIDFDSFCQEQEYGLSQGFSSL